MGLSVFFVWFVFLFTWLGFGPSLSQASQAVLSCGALLETGAESGAGIDSAFQKLYSEYKRLEAVLLSEKSMSDSQFIEKRRMMALVMGKILHQYSYRLEEMVLEKEPYYQNFVLQFHEVAFNYQKLIPVHETVLNPFLNRILEKASRLLLTKNNISFLEIPRENLRDELNSSPAFEIQPSGEARINRLAAHLQSKSHTQVIYDFSFLRNRSSAVEIETGKYFIDLKGMLEPNNSEYVPHEVLHGNLAFKRRQGQGFLLDGILIDHTEKNLEVSQFIFDEIPGYGITIRVLLRKILDSRSLTLIPILKGALRRARQYAEKLDSISTEFIELAAQNKLSLRLEGSPSALKSWELYHGGRVILLAHGRSEMTLSEAVQKLEALKVYVAEKSRIYREIDLAFEDFELQPSLESFKKLADFVRSQRLR